MSWYKTEMKWIDQVFNGFKKGGTEVMILITIYPGEGDDSPVCRGGGVKRC
jgi:hypothetical protein